MCLDYAVPKRYWPEFRQVKGQDEGTFKGYKVVNRERGYDGSYVAFYTIGKSNKWLTASKEPVFGSDISVSNITEFSVFYKHSALCRYNDDKSAAWEYTYEEIQKLMKSAAEGNIYTSGYHVLLTKKDAQKFLRSYAFEPDFKHEYEIVEVYWREPHDYGFQEGVPVVVAGEMFIPEASCSNHK